jgi:hypothetical protein
MATVDTVGDARRRVERNATQQQVLQQKRVVLVSELGRLAALEQPTVQVRKELRVLDEQLEEAAAAQPYLAGALRQAEHDEAERTGAALRSRYAGLMQDRRRYAADITTAVSILAGLLAKANTLADESMLLAKQLRVQGSAGLVAKRQTALRNWLTARLQPLVGGHETYNDGYAVENFSDVEEELLAGEMA